MKLIATLIDDKSHTFAGEVNVNFFFSSTSFIRCRFDFVSNFFYKIDMEFFLHSELVGVICFC